MSQVLDINGEATRPATRVAVCVPCGDQVAAGFAFDLARMLAVMAHQRPDVELRLFMQRDSILPRARQTLAQQALDAGCSHILWLDSDMRFPKTALVRLLAHEEPVVGANYVTRRAPCHPVAVMGDGERLYTEPASEGLEEVLATGFGVMLVDTDVLRALPAPWFAFGYDAEAGQHLGEDVFFCQRVREAGLRILIDHDLSKDVGHLGEWEYRVEHALAYRQAATAGSHDGDH